MKRFNESIPYSWKSTTVKFVNDRLNENEGILSVGMDTLVFKSHDTIYRFKHSVSAQMHPSTIEDVIGTLAGILETNASGMVDLEFDLAKSYYERHYYTVEDSIIWNILDEAIKWAEERSRRKVCEPDVTEDEIVEVEHESVPEISTYEINFIRNHCGLKLVSDAKFKEAYIMLVKEDKINPEAFKSCIEYSGEKSSYQGQMIEKILNDYDELIKEYIGISMIQDMKEFLTNNKKD